MKRHWIRFTFGFWVAAWASVGLLIPIAALTGYWLFDTMFGSGIAIFWPSSIFLMALDSPTPPPFWTAAPVVALSVLGNVFIYSVLGSVFWFPVLVAGHFSDRRHGASKRKKSTKAKRENISSSFIVGAIVVAVVSAAVMGLQGYYVARRSESLPDVALSYVPWLGALLGLGAFVWVGAKKGSLYLKWTLAFILVASFIALASIGVVPFTVMILGVKHY